ncbi:hypothetical protein SAMN04487988_12230 [Algoriphagus hitonicola]|uniref:Transmembrane protein n=1 Tax=Algoriphagus hitonicola TaxID=435880 RepID=A0A1I2XT31_9BACT
MYRDMGKEYLTTKDTKNTTRPEHRERKISFVNLVLFVVSSSFYHILSRPDVSYPPEQPRLSLV